MDIAATIREAVDLSAFPNLPAGQSKGNQLPPIPAIYVVFSPPREIIYIGRASNLQKRWRTHNFMVASWRVLWFEVVPAEQGLLESQLIQLFKPDLNIVHNPSMKGRRRRRV